MFRSVLVDRTPPNPGTVRDGSSEGVDWVYSSDETAAYSNWNGFYDPESSLAGYNVQTVVSGKPHAVQSDVSPAMEAFADLSVHLQHGDSVRSIITAINGAGKKTSQTTNGYLIDTTPPELLALRYLNSIEGEPFYQSVSNAITAVWSYQDLESGVKGYRVAIHELKYGRTFTAYPAVGDWVNFAKQGSDGDLNVFSRNGLQLANGARYTVKVMAINNAGLSVIHNTEPLRVDTTAPYMRYVSTRRFSVITGYGIFLGGRRST